MKVRWSRVSHEDLRSILERLGAENPIAAKRFVRRLDGVLRRIGQFPEAAQAVEQRLNVRRVPLVRYPFVLFYTVDKSEAIILRIRHGAMENPLDGETEM